MTEIEPEKATKMENKTFAIFKQLVTYFYVC